MAVMIVIGVVCSVFWELEFSVELGVDLTVTFYALKVFLCLVYMVKSHTVFS